MVLTQQKKNYRLELFKKMDVVKCFSQFYLRFSILGCFAVKNFIKIKHGTKIKKRQVTVRHGIKFGPLLY